ncbi:unnamed protein product [Meloidogyne enterolobii]|uniref:Uncharacterized protein n=1 Tax=Meloidogyne enterolobii TaxID=390850 RepID=A0ACB0ZVA4_MELEN
MKDFNGLYFQIKNKAIILYFIYAAQNKLKPSVILNNEELKECEKLLEEDEERPLKFENLKGKEFYMTILENVCLFNRVGNRVVCSEQMFLTKKFDNFRDFSFGLEQPSSK